jgi:hypothetical protein
LNFSEVFFFLKSRRVLPILMGILMLMYEYDYSGYMPIYTKGRDRATPCL